MTVLYCNINQTCTLLTSDALVRSSDIRCMHTSFNSVCYSISTPHNDIIDDIVVRHEGMGQWPLAPCHIPCLFHMQHVHFVTIRPELRGVTLHRLLMYNRLEDFVTLPHNLMLRRSLLQVCLNIPFRHTVTPSWMTKPTGVVSWHRSDKKQTVLFNK